MCKRRARTRNHWERPSPRSTPGSQPRGSPEASPPRGPPHDRPAGSPRPGVSAPARGKCLAFGRSKSRRTASARKMRAGGEGPHALPPQAPAPLFPAAAGPASLALRTSPPRPRRRPRAPGRPPRSPRPAPALVAVEFPQPIAPLPGEAALRAGGRRS